MGVAFKNFTAAKPRYHRVNSIFVYFDNDQAGYAAKDALELRELVRSRGALRPEAA
jgi:uncharacterized protein YecE (DUF72 family)